MNSMFGNMTAADGVVHFIGVGGIGMSGLALVLAKNGFKVTGSDLSHGYTEDELKQAGVSLFTGHDAKNITADVALVVVSTAIKDTNVELVEARKRGIKVVHRSDILAEIMKHYQTVAVAGTHGKTSTTALIYSVLKAAGMPVGVINGGVLNAVGSNVVMPPKGGWLVVEADESDASFLKFKPTVAVITNIEPEHMDTYGTEEKLVQSFIDFAASADEVVLCADDPNCLIVAQQLDDKDVTCYGLHDDADVYAEEYAPQMGDSLEDVAGQMAFDAVLRGGRLEDVVVNQPGVHYVLNSLAALAVAQLLKADMVKAAEGLASFAGVGRRFSRVGKFCGATVIDDYGHHPTEISVTLEAAKGMFSSGKVVAVIQPHRFTRLRDLMDEFAQCVKVADACVLMPVYPAGEEPIAGVNHEVLASKISLPEVVKVAHDEESLRAALQSLELTSSDAILCLGAGSISGMAKNLGKA